MKQKILRMLSRFFRYFDFEIVSIYSEYGNYHKKRIHRYHVRKTLHKNRRNREMNFGKALEALKEGKKVAREGWNGKGMFVYYVPAGNFKSYTDIGKSIADENDLVHYNPYFAIKNVNGTVSTWVPSINDCLAEDWVIVE